ncbi:MAG: hypothetical protein AB7S38_31775 [Vulcanimicrobiota bacterium]
MESLVFRLEREREEKLYDSFTLLGQDNEDVSVDFALAAQREGLGAPPLPEQAGQPLF